MESEEDKWMHKFHEEVQDEQDREDETRDLRDRVRQLSMQVEEGETVRRDYERLREEEKERRERENKAYEQEMDEFKQFVLNNFPPRRGQRVTDEVNRSRYQKDAGCNTDLEQERAAAERSHTLRRETPAGYRRATATDPDVFLRKQDKARREERRKEACRPMDDTESGDSDDGRFMAAKQSRSSKPWPLKREKRVVGSEMFQRRMHQDQP